MARYIEQGKSIFIPFHKGVSITDSQLHLRMYKTEEMFKRHGYACGEVDVLCEYAPVVRCKDCKHWHKETGWCYHHSHFVDEKGGACHPWESSNWAAFNEDDFCSMGERKGDG